MDRSRALQKASIEKEAAEQRKHVALLAQERDRVARAASNTESAKIANDIYEARRTEWLASQETFQDHRHAVLVV